MFKYYLPLYDEEKIPNYKEFDKKIKTRDDIPKKAGIPMPHQELIGNLLVGATPINKLLLVHDMGTGKSCTAINAIEKNIRDGIYGMSHAIILNRGKAIMNNFINELVNKCTTHYNTGNEKIQKNLWSKFYTFETFEIFSKKIKKMSNKSILNNYNNTFLVIDEVHNLLNEESNAYTEISRFISIIPNLKVLLLTGTPVKDSPEDFVPIINLILSDEEKIDQKTFYDTCYDSNGELNYDFKKKLMNKVSYLKSSIPEIKVIEVGNPILNLKKFNVVSHYMQSFQNDIYNESYKKDFKDLGVYNNSRQASRFVFPDGTYGMEGFNSYISKSNVRILEDSGFSINKQYKFKTSMINELKKYGSDRNSIMKRIKELSIKYHFIIEKIFEANDKNEKSLVYDDLVKGSGLIVLSLLLSFLGFKKHRLLTSETSTISEISKIQKIFNEDTTGQRISVILGSKVIAEGFTFLDVLHEHVVPHWNNTETMQVIARGIRMGSHNKILKLNPNSFISIYRNISLSNEETNSIDYIMTKTSESKEIEIDKIIDVIKETSITCNEFKERNGGKCLNFDTEKIIDNYISIGSLEIKKLEEMYEFFKNNIYGHFNYIKNSLKFEIDEELLKYLHWFLDKKPKIINKKGVECYLNNIQNFYFLTENIRTESDVLMSYYTEDLKPFSEYKLYEDAISLEIVNFESNKNIQRLLELSTTIKLLNLKVTKIKKVDEILLKYKDNWMIDYENNYAAVWYLSDIVEEKANIRCLVRPQTDKPWNEWTKCSKLMKQNIFDKRNKETEEFEKKLKNSDIQYYGLWNPILKEFCIKNITDNITQIDKRQISSGKRCINWKKDELLTIARDNLQMDRNWDLWISNNRNYICNDIKNFLKQNNLLIENKSCGVQTKKKLI